MVDYFFQLMKRNIEKKKKKREIVNLVYSPLYILISHLFFTRCLLVCHSWSLSHFLFDI